MIQISIFQQTRMIILAGTQRNSLAGKRI
jgi:hypothetical protein